MKNLIHYKVFENNIKFEDFPKYGGTDLTEREMMIINQTLGKSIVPKIFRKITITKDDGYYYVRTISTMNGYGGYVEQYFYMVYESFKELLEYLTFKKHLYNNNSNKVITLINSEPSIDLTFDGGYLLHWIIYKGVPFDDNCIRAIESLCKYKFEVSVISRCIERLMYLSLSEVETKIRVFSREFSNINIDINVYLVKLLLNNNLGGRLSDLIRIAIERQVDIRFLQAFVNNKYFSPEVINPLHRILSLCAWKEDLESMELLLDKGVRIGISSALETIKGDRYKGDVDEKISDEMEKLLNKFKSKGEN
jgi:hypothetical protein